VVVALSSPVDDDIVLFNGILYGIGLVPGNLGFGTIDPTTGTVTLINAGTVGQGFTANPNLSVFYSTGSTGRGLNNIQFDGSSTRIGGHNDFDTDIAYDSRNDVLYGYEFANSGIDIISTTSGEAAQLSTHIILPTGRQPGNLAYDSTDDTLYLISVGAQTRDLYSIDRATGLPTLIAPTGIPSSTRLVGFADVQNTPEPSTAGLMGFALAAVAVGRWCRARRTANRSN